MKVIDEKGRLFGRINLIDFLVILLLLGIIPMFYFGYKLYNKNLTITAKKEKLHQETVEVKLPFKLINVPIDMVKLVALGDKEVNEHGDVIGEIDWLDVSRPYKLKLDLGEETIINEPQPEKKEIPIRLKVKPEMRESSLYYKNKQIIIGSPIEFKTAKYTLLAVPVKAVPVVKEEKRSTEKIDLYVILKNLTEELIPLISVGNKELDKDGEVIAEILKIGKMENDIRDINLGSGHVVTGENSSKRQLFVQMRLKCEINGEGNTYFKGEELNYNSLLGFNFPNYTTQGRLASILLNEKWVEVMLKFSGVIPELVKVINEGNIEKDATGRIVGRLKAIISIKPSESQVLVLEQNKFITIPQLFQKDIYIALNLLCIEKDGALHYKNYPVKMGNALTFSTDLYSLQGLIIGLTVIDKD